MISFQLDATPIWGLSQSSSPMPTARSMPREPVASRPSVTTRERGLMSMPSVVIAGNLVQPAVWVDGPEVGTVRRIFALCAGEQPASQREFRT